MVRLGALAATALIGLSATAFAADMGIPSAYPSYPALQPEAPVELGTGWYLRGDVAFTRETTPQIFGPSVTAGPIGSQLLNTGTQRSSWAAALGFGYQFNNWVRGDLTYEYRNTIQANASSAQFGCVSDPTGLCFAAQKASIKQSVALANLYIDLGTWSGLTPYVGAGAGFVYGVRAGNYSWYNASNGSIYAPSFQYVNNRTSAFAWALMAGFAYQLTDRAKIDIGYRYMNMGNWSKAAGSKALTSNEVRVGFRYAID
ncbi:MAG: hypothetical protein BGP04_04535 [Rhizobiales bacterium 62-17]|nr:porin family protein [Hyphomicrobiales bacterium]OJY02608.1 MAG: hypothetical protein BGP04_04535 [Rhizobiales bacterium 62-17]